MRECDGANKMASCSYQQDQGGGQVRDLIVLEADEGVPDLLQMEEDRCLVCRASRWVSGLRSRPMLLRAVVFSPQPGW